MKVLIQKGNSVTKRITGTGRCDRPMRPHHTSVERTPLVYSVRVRRVQISRARLQVSLWAQVPYLTNDCQLVANSGRCRLQSADIDSCIILRMNTQLGDSSFAVAGPRLWNTLPTEFRQPDTELVTFRWLLKTHFFKCDPGA